MDIAAIKQGMLDEFGELKKKEASLGDRIGAGADWLYNPGLKGVETFMRSPGTNPLTAALTGAGLGTAYHLGKRHLYNTEEEHQAEDAEGYMTPLKRIALPAAALGLTGLMQSSMTPKYYQGREDVGPTSTIGRLIR